MTSYIDKNILQKDMWFTRGEDWMAIENRISSKGGVLPNTLEDLVGVEMFEPAFLSTSVKKGGGLSYYTCTLNIYAPKGTKGAYLEPFSSFGNGDKRRWDGIKRFSTYSQEQECLLQRGTTLRITKAYKEGEKLYIDCEVISQEPTLLSDVKDNYIATL